MTEQVAGVVRHVQRWLYIVAANPEAVADAVEDCRIRIQSLTLGEITENMTVDQRLAAIRDRVNEAARLASTLVAQYDSLQLGLGLLMAQKALEER